MNGDYRNISEILTEVMKERGVGVDALSNATDIPKRFIDSLVRGDFENLPAKPYVRGYLFKIAEALRIDQNILWQSYKNSTDLATSGEQDKLPTNRFAFKKMRTSGVVALFFLVILLVFVGFKFNDMLGKPTIDVSLPEFTTEDTITITGNVRPGDTLTLNKEVIYPNEEGYFEKRVQLQPGGNPLSFVVKRYLGRETVLDEHIFYQPEPAQPQLEEE